MKSTLPPPSHSVSPRKASAPARIVPRGGEFVVHKIGARSSRFRDLYYRVLASSWPSFLLHAALAYVFVNGAFAAMFLLGGDCIENARPGNFLDSFYFSVQTFATIGYGKLLAKTEYAQMLVVLESFVGILAVALLTGLMFAKFSKANARVLFSSVAVVSVRDGVPCLMFRKANERGNRIVDAQIRAFLIRTEHTREGERMRRFIDLPLVRSSTPFFQLTRTSLHVIDESSPLYGYTATSLEDADIEVTGLDETVSQTVHARHSYVSDEIIWNARFVDIMSLGPDGVRHIDYTKFHDVVVTESAR